MYMLNYRRCLGVLGGLALLLVLPGVCRADFIFL
jgi:hypothetical protein